MKKIGLFLSAQPHDGGAFQYSQSMLDALCSLRDHGYEIVIATSSASWKEQTSRYGIQPLILQRDFGERNFNRPRFINMPVSLSRAVFPRIFSLGKSLTSQQCNLWVFPAQDVWSYQIPVPSLVAVYDLMHRYEKRFPEVSVKGEYRMREWRYRNICRWSRGILADSAVGKRHIHESYGYPEDRIHILPFIAPPFIPAYNPDREFDLRYHLPKKFIFYPAQFWQHKNHIGLIRAIAKLRESAPDIQCFFLGSKKNGYQAAFDLVSDLGLDRSVHFLGYVPGQDMPLFYRRARALIMPTFFGPTNIPPLEAFSHGCPVAISRIYGIPEQVGDAALLFNPESVDSIADALLKIWKDDFLCEDLKKKGLEKSARWGQPQFNATVRAIIETVLSRA